MAYTNMSGVRSRENPVLDLSSVATITTAGAVTYTAAQLLGRVILRDPNGASRTDTTPTAQQLKDLLSNVQNGIGVAFEFTIRNTADAAETITVGAGTGVTLSGTMTIAQNNSKRFMAVFTAWDSPAVTLYSLGTVVH